MRDACAHCGKKVETVELCEPCRTLWYESPQYRVLRAAVNSGTAELHSLGVTLVAEWSYTAKLEALNSPKVAP